MLGGKASGCMAGAFIWMPGGRRVRRANAPSHTLFFLRFGFPLPRPSHSVCPFLDYSFFHCLRDPEMSWLWPALIVQCMVLWFAGHATARCVASGDEEIFAHFFDIPLDAAPGDEVTGRLHPKSNKEFSASTYEFSLLDDADGMFNVTGRRDYWGPVYGVLTYTGAAPLALGAYNVSAELRIDGVLRGCTDFAVQCSNETLMQRMLPRLIDYATGEGRLWGKEGKHKPSEAEVEAWIGELEANDGQLRDPATQTVYAFYNNTPGQRQTDTGFTDDWSAAIKVVGGLGYAYHTHAAYAANATRRHRLRQAMYLGLEALARSLPLFHADVTDAAGRPVGADFGDGLANCDAIAGNDKTHQWVFTDPLCLPALLLVGDLVREGARRDTRAQRLHAGLVYLFQPPFTLLVNRRRISGPGHRWDDLVELDHVNGAWADANRGHRYPGMAAMLGVWHDYNRPITYVPYWYADYDFRAAGLTEAPGDAVPAGFSLLPGWSPRCAWQGLAGGDAQTCGAPTVLHSDGNVRGALCGTRGYGEDLGSPREFCIAVVLSTAFF